MVFGALQIALATAWTTLVAAELIAADTGLGFLITMGRKLTLPGLVVLGMVSVRPDRGVYRRDHRYGRKAAPGRNPEVIQ